MPGVRDDAAGVPCGLAGPLPETDPVCLPEGQPPERDDTIL